MAATAIAASGNANLTERRDGHMVVGLGGLEPPTSSLSAKRSNRLSYRPVLAYAERRDYRNRARLSKH